MIYPSSHKIREIWDWVTILQGEYLRKKARIDSMTIPIIGNGNISIHCHNQEDKEINSISGIDITSVAIYKDGIFLDYGAHNTETHNKVYSIISGSHVIEVRFNGMIIQQNIGINPNQTQVLTFTFIRVDFNLINWLSGVSINEEVNLSWDSDSGEEEIIKYLGTLTETQLKVGHRSYVHSSGEVKSLVVFTGSHWRNYNLYTISSGNDSTFAYSDIWDRNSLSVSTTGLPNPTTIFNKWYLQSILNDWVGGIRFYSNDELIGSIGSISYLDLDGIPPYSNTYFLQEVAAYREITDVKLGFIHDFFGACALANWDVSSEERNLEGDIIDLRYSSVPYDILGTAI